MNAMQTPTDHNVETRDINGTPCTVTTFCIENTWHTTVANVDPGANIARAHGTTRDEAVSEALRKATERIKH